MLLNLDKKFVDLDGVEADGKTMALVLCESLAMGSGKSNTIPMLKGYEIIKKLKKDGCIEIDNSDLDSLERYIKDESNFNRWMGAQLLEEISNCKLAHKQSEKENGSSKSGKTQ